MRAAELRHRVVAVLIEHPTVQALRALATRCGAGADGIGVRFDPVGELVEEKPADRLGCPRVPREERPLDRFREAGQDEDRLVGVAEVRCKRGGLRVGEALRDCQRRMHTVGYTSLRGSVRRRLMVDRADRSRGGRRAVCGLILSSD